MRKLLPVDPVSKNKIFKNYSYSIPTSQEVQFFLLKTIKIIHIPMLKN